MPRPITGAVHPCGVAVDQTHIYWEAGVADPAASSDDGVIGRANLDGTGVDQHFIASPGRPTGGLAVDGAHIYWTNFASSSIGRANLDGTGVDEHFITGAPGGPCGVAVDGAHVLFNNGATDGSGLFWI